MGHGVDASCFAGYKGGVITNCTKSAIVSFKVGKASQTPNVASVFDLISSVLVPAA